jgi:hypothetical protein
LLLLLLQKEEGDKTMKKNRQTVKRNVKVFLPCLNQIVEVEE